MRDEAQIIQDYQSGMSTNEVGKRHSCAHHTVRAVLKRNGISIRTLKEAQQLLAGHIEPLNEAQIIQDYESGMSSPEVGEKHGCNDKTVCSILKRNGIPRRTKKEAQQLFAGHIEPLHEAQIIQDYKSGMTSHEVGKRHGCAHSSVILLLKRNSISPRTKQEAGQLRYGHIEVLNEAQIIQDYLSGMSSIQVGKKHGCNGTTVVRILKRNGIPRRTRQEATLLHNGHLGILDEDLLHRFKNKKS